MDPVSIASLAGTAARVCISLYELINNIKDADSKLSDLSKEVKRFTDLVQSVEKVVKQCQPQTLTLAHLDDHIWQQIKNTLADCKVNLDGLDDLVNRLSNRYDPKAKNLAKVLNKSTLYLHSEFYSDDIAEYTDKIYKSNCAMQTSLVVVNVSLSFRTNISQDSLFQELEELKGLIRKSLEAALKDDVSADNPASRQNTNLEGLAKAAQKFYSSASSTASTLYGRGDRGAVASVWGGSEGYGLSDFERERIEQWNDLATVKESEEDSMTEVTLFSGQGDTSTTITSQDVESLPQNTEIESESHMGEEEEDDEDDSDEELDLSQTFEKLALASFAAHDYNKAEQCLRKVLERQTSEASASNRAKLRLQLALSCCLQEKWDPAAEIIALLPKTASASNLPVFDLLQAVSIALLQGNRLQDASRTCKVVLRGKKKIMGRHSHDYYECLSLFAAICEKRGESLEAEAVRHLIPTEWASENSDLIQTPKQFILSHDSLAGLISYPTIEDESPRDEDNGPESHPQSPSVEASTSSLVTDATIAAQTGSQPASLSNEVLESLSATNASIDRVTSNDPLPSSQSDSLPLLTSYLGPIKGPGSRIKLPSQKGVQIRWTVRKDIGNIGGPRPFGVSRASQFLLPFKPIQNSEAWYIVLKDGWRLANQQIALSQVSDGVTIHDPDEKYIIEGFADGFVFTIKHLRHRMIRKTPLAISDIDNSSQLRRPRDWLQMLGTKNLEGESTKWFSHETDASFVWTFTMPNIELKIAELISQVEGKEHSETIHSSRLDGLVYTVPDLTYRLDWMILTKMMIKYPLMQHARVIPHSLAILQYYYDSGGLIPYEPDKAEQPMAVVVLHCDDCLVECVPYLVRLVCLHSQDQLEVTESPSSFMAEVAGFQHVRRACMRLIGAKIGPGYILTYTEPWQKQLSRILRLFERNGKAWDIAVDTAAVGKEEKGRRLTISNVELLECFTPSVALVRKMLEQTIVELGDRKVSHVVVAGAYSESKYLLSEIQVAVDTLRLVNGGPMHFLHSPVGDKICAIGALSHGMSR